MKIYTVLYKKYCSLPDVLIFFTLYTFLRKHLDPQNLQENILWTELFGRFESSYIWHETNTLFYFKKIMPTVKHGGGSVVVSGGWMTCCNCRNHELCSLLENPKAKCPAILFFPEAQRTLGFAAGK